MEKTEDRLLTEKEFLATLELQPGGLSMAECRQEILKTQEEDRGGNFSPETLRTVRKLVADGCGNHQRIGPWKTPNFCWMREKSSGGVCHYFSGAVRKCRWFEMAVLSLRDDLKETYFEEIQEEMSNGGKIEDRKTDAGKSTGQGPGNVQQHLVKVEVRRITLGEHRREDFLSRNRIHGMALETQKESSRHGRGKRGLRPI